MRMPVLTLLVAFGAGLTGTSAAGQAAGPGPNPNGTPAYGTIDSSAFFSGERRSFRVTEGGTYDAAALGGDCSGFIEGVPDLRITHTANGSPLIISVRDSSDTMLVVWGPDGRWTCDNDSGVDGLNPSIRWSSPRSGAYNIWVGQARRGHGNGAHIYVSQTASQ